MDKLVCPCVTPNPDEPEPRGKNEHRTSNVQHRMGKDEETEDRDQKSVGWIKRSESTENFDRFGGFVAYAP